MKRIKAFTLIELLVVISIIALLLAILMPSLRQAKEQAHRTVCATNEKQMLIACDTYASSNNQWYPVGGGDGIDGHLLNAGFLESPGLFQCRSDNADFGTLSSPVTVPASSTVAAFTKPEPGDRITERTRENYRTYGFNLNYWGWAYNGGWRKQTEVRKPTTTILISETPTLYNLLYLNHYEAYFGPVPPNKRSSYGRVSGYTHWCGWDVYAASRRNGFIHGRGCNFGFADGHAEYIEVDIEKEFPPFDWFDNGLYTYNRWPRYSW